MALKLPPRRWSNASIQQISTNVLLKLLTLLAKYTTEGRETHRKRGLCSWVVYGGTDTKGAGITYLDDEVGALHSVLGIFGWPQGRDRRLFDEEGWTPERQYIADRAALYVRGTLLLRGVPLSPMPHLDDIARGMNLPHFQEVADEPAATYRSQFEATVTPVPPAAPQPKPAPTPPKAGTQAARVLRALQEGRNTLGRIAAYAQPCTETSASARIRELRSLGYTISLSKFRVFGTRSYHYTYTLED